MLTMRGPAVAAGPTRIGIDAGSNGRDSDPGAARQVIVIAPNCQPRENNSLLGFADLVLPSGLVIRDVILHEAAGGRWVWLPGKMQLAANGSVRIDPKTGKRLYRVSASE